MRLIHKAVKVIDRNATKWLHSLAENPFLLAFLDEMHILGGVVALDGRLEQREMDIVGQYLRLRAADNDITYSEENLKQALDWTAINAMSAEEFEIGHVPRLSQEGAEGVSQVIEIIAELDGHLSEPEIRYIASVRSSLASLPKS